MCSIRTGFSGAVGRLALLACSSNHEQAVPTAISLVAPVISPATLSLARGGSAKLVASWNGVQTPTLLVMWQSSDTLVAIVSIKGMVQARGA